MERAVIMVLFEYAHRQQQQKQTPLAARMRPRTLDEFIGQEGIIGHGRLLRRAIQADQLSSLIFWGPPGTGKTTLAQIIANTTHAHFIAINAVLSGVKEIRESVKDAEQRRNDFAQRTILFVDEVHRFNKSQQDALLPWVENGTLILIGATTENPYFEVNKALVSRSRIFQLRPLNDEDLRCVAQQALLDHERGYGDKKIAIAPEALAHLANIANGDARTLLNALELAVDTTIPDAEAVIRIDLAVAEESIQRRAVLYDKEGDAHFDAISAFIKSLRGSDADAALYWLARMVQAGEDPRFILRRMIIAACEDIGLADPNAISVVVACASAFERVGMPEGNFMLAQAALYLATAPKSNSTMGFFDALRSVERERTEDVPAHLKDANRDGPEMGHGQQYLYPHAYRDHWVAQQYLPASLQGQIFYQPSQQGYEGKVAQEVARRREAQLAAAIEGQGLAPPEVLTRSPDHPQLNRWLQRIHNEIGSRLATVRDTLLSLVSLQRHHVVLDLRAGSGLLVWEVVRQTPEGGLFARAETPLIYEALREQSRMLPELLRPVLFSSSLASLPTQIYQYDQKLRFDRVVGYNALLPESNKSQHIAALAALLRPLGVLGLAEGLPRRTQRLYQLLQSDALSSDVYRRLCEAEENSIYEQTEDPKLCWQPEDLCAACTYANLDVQIHIEPMQTSVYIDESVLSRWFDMQSQQSERPSYAAQISPLFSAVEMEQIRAAFYRQLMHQKVEWQSATLFLIAKRSE
jgi:putative ATPase